MRGIVALLWNPGPLVLELRRKSLPHNWINALPLAPPPIHPRPAGPGERHDRLASLATPPARAEPCRALGEMGLVSGYFLQGLLVRQKALPNQRGSFAMGFMSIAKLLCLKRKLRVQVLVRVSYTSEHTMGYALVLPVGTRAAAKAQDFRR